MSTLKFRPTSDPAMQRLPLLLTKLAIAREEIDMLFSKRGDHRPVIRIRNADESDIIIVNEVYEGQVDDVVFEDDDT